MRWQEAFSQHHTYSSFPTQKPVEEQINKSGTPQLPKQILIKAVHGKKKCQNSWRTIAKQLLIMREGKKKQQLKQHNTTTDMKLTVPRSRRSLPLSPQKQQPTFYIVIICMDIWEVSQTHLNPKNFKGNKKTQAQTLPVTISPFKIMYCKFHHRSTKFFICPSSILPSRTSSLIKHVNYQILLLSWGNLNT